ncbi:MAG: FCD domain-containing protein [Pseudomonadota bacterium]
MQIVDNLHMILDRRAMARDRMTSIDDLPVLKTASLSLVLRDEIERIILSGALKPGERVNEKALAERFGVSRGPVREALQALSARGLVEQIPNRGVFVQRITRHDAVEIYDVRAGLFGTACRLLADRMDSALSAELRVLLEQMDGAGAKRDLEAYYPLNIAFHERIVEGAGNAILRETYSRMVSRLHLYRARGLVHGGGFERSNIEHRVIVDALDDRDPQAAFEAGFAHVQEGKRRVVLSRPDGLPESDAGQDADDGA